MKNFGDFVHLEAYSNVSSKLMPDLTAVIGQLRKKRDYSQAAMEEAGVSEVVKAHTGMKINFRTTADVWANAYFVIPGIDTNNEFNKQVSKYYPYLAGTGTSLLKDHESLRGFVDLNNYRVSGIFSEIPLDIVLGHSFLDNKNYKDDELAAIVSHELGHAWDYFRLLGQLVGDSMIISNAAKVVAGGEKNEVKTKVLVKAKEQLGIEELNIEDLISQANINSGEYTELVLVTNSYLAQQSQSSTKNYDYRNLEQSADSFVAFHGGSRPLATGLSKIYKQTGNRATDSIYTYLICETIKTALTAFLIVSAPISAVVFLVSIAPSTKTYDDPKERIITLKQQTLHAIRTTKNEEHKKAMLEDIKALDAVIERLNDRKTIYEAIYYAATPNGRKKHNEEQHRMMIKNILFNDLQAKALEWRTK